MFDVVVFDGWLAVAAGGASLLSSPCLACFSVAAARKDFSTSFFAAFPTKTAAVIIFYG